MTEEHATGKSLREMTCTLEGCERGAVAFYPATNTARCEKHLPTDNPTLPMQAAE